METSNIIEVTHLNKQFLVDKQPMEVLHDISLQVKQGEFITIVGHSGCGKSTLLKIICGLVDYEDGQVERNGHPVTGSGPKCGMVFQDHRLLPWLKIKDRIRDWRSAKAGTGGKSKKTSRACRAGRIRKQLSESAVRRYVTACRNCQRTGEQSDDPASG